MSHQRVAQTNQQTQSTPPLASGILQRKSACGQHTVAGGECAGCRQQRQHLQRRATNRAEPTTVPPIVYEVLRSPGRSLDPATRTFMHTRFGHDFSQVRVHTDARAAESTRVVNAVAYTVGRNVVLGAGQYAPTTVAGRRLLAHELTHVVQQASSTSISGGIGSVGDPNEHEADRVAASVLTGQETTIKSATSTPPLQRLEHFRLTPPTLRLPPRQPLSLFPPGEELRLRLDLLDLRNVTRIRPVTPTLPPFLTGLPPSSTGPSAGEEEEVRPLWALEFEMEADEDSPLGQALESEERTEQILSTLSGEEAEETPLGVNLLTAAVNLLAATPQGRALRDRLGLTNVTVVANPAEGTFGVIVEYEF